MRNKFFVIFLGCIFLSLFLFPFLDESSKYSLQEARKVFRLIDKIQEEQLKEYEGPLRKVEITESEFNSWIAYRIETEKEEIMKELRLKIFKNNMLEGKIYFDLRGQNIPRLLRPEMNLYFRGKVEVKDAKVRIALKSLFLEEQPIQPKILDLIIYVSSKIQNTEASSINDWYELPYGIKDIKTQNGKATFYY